MSANAETVDGHLAYMMRLGPGEVIREATDKFYTRNLKNKSDEELNDVPSCMLKQMIESRLKNPSSSFALNYQSLQIQMRNEQKLADAKVAEMGAIGEAFKYLILQGNNAITALREVHTKSIEAVEKSYKDSSSTQASIAAMESLRTENAAIRAERDALKEEIRELKEDFKIKYVEDLNHITAQRDLEHQIEDLNREMQRTEEEWRKKIQEESQGTEEDKEKFLLFRDSFFTDMEKLIKRSSDIKDLWDVIKGMTSKKKEEPAPAKENAA